MQAQGACRTGPDRKELSHTKTNRRNLGNDDKTVHSDNTHQGENFMKLTRRDFFKGVGAGTALAGLGTMARPAPALAKTASTSRAAPMSRSLDDAEVAGLE